MEAGIFKWAKNEKGFTFVELALIIAIAGFMLVPVYYLMFNLMRIGPTDQRIEAIRYGIGEYYRIWGRLPCPGNLTAAPNTAGYDSEVRDAATKACTSGIDAGDVFIGSVPVKDIAAAMDCLHNIDRVAYIADLPVDAKDILQRNINRVRQREAEKFAIQKQNCVTIDMLLDEYDNKIVYAVTKDTTRLSTFDPALDYDADTTNDVGKIFIQDRGGNPLSIQPQWFVLVTMGEDRKGAYDRFGNQGVACTSSPGVDQENCDYNDGIFIDMPTALTFDNNHYDDEIDYSLDNALSEHSFWFWKGDDSLDARDMTFQPNTRIMIDEPATVTADDMVAIGGAGNNLSVKMDGTSAGGNIKVEGANKGVYAPKYCYNGTGC